MPDKYVLDSFALLGYLQAEPSHARVKEVIATAAEGRAELFLCVVNYGEILYQVERRRGPWAVKQTVAIIDRLPVTVVDANRSLTFAAAHIKAGHTISYADAFAVALAQAQGATVLTGDPEFKEVEHLIPLEWLSTRCNAQEVVCM